MVIIKNNSKNNKKKYSNVQLWSSSSSQSHNTKFPAASGAQKRKIRKERKCIEKVQTAFRHLHEFWPNIYPQDMHSSDVCLPRLPPLRAAPLAPVVRPCCLVVWQEENQFQAHYENTTRTEFQVDFIIYLYLGFVLRTFVFVFVFCVFVFAVWQI